MPTKDLSKAIVFVVGRGTNWTPLKNLLVNEYSDNFFYIDDKGTDRAFISIMSFNQVDDSDFGELNKWLVEKYQGQVYAFTPGVGFTTEAYEKCQGSNADLHNLIADCVKRRGK